MNPRLVDELCAKGNLESQRSTLEKILVQIHNDGCWVSTCSNTESSSIGPSAGHKYHIRISILNVHDPLYIIWRLFHEYGHYLSGPKKPGDSLLSREELAWKYADKLVKQYPDLVKSIGSYERCKAYDLNSYFHGLEVR